MPRFAYSAIDRSGSLIKGELSAPSEMSALDQLGRKGLTPVTVDEGGVSGPWWSRDISLTGTSSRLKIAEQARFFATLHTMLSAKFTLVRALTFAVERTRDARTKRVVQGLADDVSAGGTLSDALADSDAFEQRFIGLIQIGDAANKLEDVTGTIAQMLEIEQRNARQVRQALVYPAILMLMSCAVLVMLIFFLAPTLVPVFRSANVAPPALLSALDQTRQVLSANWTAVFLGLGIFLVATALARQSIAATFMRLFSLLPGLSGFLHSRRSLGFLQTLNMMLSSGARLPAALATASDTATTSEQQAQIATVQSRVEAGDTLSAALRDSKLIDTGSLAFVEAGEEGDQLPQMLTQACRMLEEQTETQLAQALRLITPALTLIIGLSVGFLIFTTIGAILDLNDLAS